MRESMDAAMTALLFFHAYTQCSINRLMGRACIHTQSLAICTYVAGVLPRYHTHRSCDCMLAFLRMHAAALQVKLHAPVLIGEGDRI